MRWFIFALIYAGSLFAQPHGPFLVATTELPSSIGGAKVVVDTLGTAHVFFEQNDSGMRFVMYSTLDASSGNVITEPVAIYFALTDFLSLEDVALTESGVPRILVFTADPNDYRLYLVQQTENGWPETLLFQDHDGWSPDGPLSHWLEFCRFVAVDDSFTQACLYNTGIAGGGWITEPFATPVACFVNSFGEVSSFRLEWGTQAAYGTLRSQSLAADSMYLWADGNFVGWSKLIARRDSTSEEIETYSYDECMYGELAGMTVSGGDQIHVSGMSLCIPACLFFQRVSGDSCSLINDVRVYPPMGIPNSFAIYEEHGFVFPLFDQNEVQLLRVDTLGNIAASVGTIAWKDGNVQITGAECGVSRSGKIATVFTDRDPATSVRRLWLASCDWLTPLNTHEYSVPVPQEISLATYPNPFNSTVRIDYELPRATDVHLSIFNTLGQEVATLYDGHTNAGSHTLSWSPNAASGVYFVKLVSGNLVNSRKILYLR